MKNRFVLCCSFGFSRFTTVVDAGIAFKNQYGNVVCGKGQCATDRYGKVLCAKEGGGDAVNLHARAFGSLQLYD